MFQIDFPTIFISYLITNIVSLSVIALLFLQINKRFPGTTFILLCFVFNSVGTFLIFMRGVIPDWISMTLGNTLIFSSGVAMLIGLQQFFGKRGPQIHNYILIFVYFIVHFYFAYFDPLLFARVLLSSFVLLSVFSQTAWFMLKNTPITMRRMARGIGLIFFAYSLIYVWRIIYLLAGDHSFTSYFNSNGSETWFIIVSQITFLFLAYNLTLMFNKRLLIEISTQEELFKGLIKNSFDMIALVDSKGIQHYVSESCEKILGFKPDELIDVPIIERMIHPEDQEFTIKDFRDIVENKASGGTQYRHRHKNGTWVYLEAFGSNQLDHPAIKSVILNVRDITERKQSEQIIKNNEIRLKELNATKDRFFSIIGHDLKSPFNNVIGFSDLILDQIQSGDYERVGKYAAIIQDSSERAMNLLKNLLEWSQAQTGKIKFNPQCIELVSVINEVLELSNDTAHQKSITILKKLPQNIPLVADKAMTHTILRNLITNALKFTNSGGELTISTEQIEKQLIVSVADNGIGMIQEDIDKLFQIDYCYSKEGTNKESGTGLGLLLCKEFIEMHKGKIWIESEIGKGSTFKFSIPNC
jgi:two-component system sensor histidine kinase/response regulator